MSPRSKKEYVEAIFLRYKHASRKEKTTILNEFCTVCGYHRKYAIRLLKVRSDSTGEVCQYLGNNSYGIGIIELYFSFIFFLTGSI